MTFERALAELKKGKTIRRKCFKYGAKIKETQWGKTIIGLKDYKYPIGFSSCDVLADDWEIVDNDSEDCRC